MWPPAPSGDRRLAVTSTYYFDEAWPEERARLAALELRQR